MKCKCPNCYATGSLEMFTSDEASQAFVSVLNLTGELAKPLIRYLGLFRSENRDLSFSRTAKLINEIAPDIVAGQISRNRQTYPAPKKAWIWAINVMLERREQGLLQLPLKTHGYLYEVISSFKADEHQTLIRHSEATSDSERPRLISEPSWLERENAKRQEQHLQQQIDQHHQLKHAPIAPEMKEFTQFLTKQLKSHEPKTLKGIPNEQLPAYLMQQRQDGESLLECYERLKKLETETTETNP